MNNSTRQFLILLVEDEASDAGLVKWALEKNKINAALRHVIDGFDALDFLRHQEPKYLDAPRPDLILLDLNMPRMGGLEFLATVKREPALSDIPVVVLSTSHAESDIFSSRDLGAADYFTKPMDIHQLLETIRVLGERWITPGISEAKNSPANLKATISLLDSLPALPKIALEIMSIKLSTDEGNDMLLKLVNKDPAILAKIIGLANSPLFGVSRIIKTAKDAAAILGFNRIKMVALSFAMISSVSRKPAGLLDVNHLWQHSMAAALAMDALASAMPPERRPPEEEIYLAGLLHDIGFLVLDFVDPKLSDYFHTTRLGTEGERLTSEIEAELLETSHCELGALLGAHWNLSAALVAVMRYHHADRVGHDEVGQPLIAMTILTEKLLPTFDLTERAFPSVDIEEWLALGIKVEQVEMVEASMRKRAEEVILSLA